MVKIASFICLASCLLLSVSATYKPHPPPPSRCGDPCGFDGLVCREGVGLTCKDYKCIRKLGEHERCGGGGRNGCRVCKFPYKCINGFCRLKSVKCGGKCEEHGITVAKCRGNKTCKKGICVAEKDLGKVCDSVCRFCKYPYICDGKHCQLKTAKCGEQCEKDGVTIATCNNNKKCIGGKCIVKKGLGKKCDSFCRPCKHPYVCEHGTCQLPTVGCGETCAEHGKVVAKCSDNKECINGKCSVKQGDWEPCDGSCKICKDHLHCVYHKCMPRKY